MNHLTPDEIAQKLAENSLRYNWDNHFSDARKTAILAKFHLYISLEVFPDEDSIRCVERETGWSYYKNAEELFVGSWQDTASLDSREAFDSEGDALDAGLEVILDEYEPTYVWEVICGQACPFADKAAMEAVSNLEARRQ